MVSNNIESETFIKICHRLQLKNKRPTITTEKLCKTINFNTMSVVSLNRYIILCDRAAKIVIDFFKQCP